VDASSCDSAHYKTQSDGCGNTKQVACTSVQTGYGSCQEYSNIPGAKCSGMGCGSASSSECPSTWQFTGDATYSGCANGATRVGSGYVTSFACYRWQ
jgi:hypothetical protein